MNPSVLNVCSRWEECCFAFFFLFQFCLEGRGKKWLIWNCLPGSPGALLLFFHFSSFLEVSLAVKVVASQSELCLISSWCDPSKFSASFWCPSDGYLEFWRSGSDSYLFQAPQLSSDHPGVGFCKVPLQWNVLGWDVVRLKVNILGGSRDVPFSSSVSSAFYACGEVRFIKHSWARVQYLKLSVDNPCSVVPESKF